MFLASLQSNPWAYPALETLHILGIALLLGNLVALEVRVWGGAASLPVLPLDVPEAVADFVCAWRQA